MSYKNKVLPLASRFDLDQDLIELYDSVRGISWEDLEIDDEFRNYELNDADTKGAVLFPLIPGYNSLLYRFAVLGHVFRTRGYQPIILYDDFDLPVRPEFTVDNTERLQAIRYRRQVREFDSQTGFETYSIGELIDNPGEYDLDTIEIRNPVYQGVSLAGCVKASTRKYFKRYSLDLSDPSIRSTYEGFLRGGMTLVDAMNRLFEYYDIDVTIINESSYIQGFVPMVVSRDHGTPTYIQGWIYQSGQLLFGRATHRHHMPQFISRDVVERALQTELTDAESDDVAQIVSSWRNNDVSALDLTSPTGNSVRTNAETTVGLFTNLLWDAAMEPSQALYDDVYEWLEDSIDALAGREDIHLVIKPHPAESIRGTQESVREWVRSTYHPLPENVTLLASDTDVDTYALFQDLDFGLVYASTVGLEMIYDGVPAVTTGYPPYRGFGITWDPTTKEEYLELVKQAGELDCSTNRRDRASRYLYLLFFCKRFDFPYWDIEEGEPRSQIRHADLTPGNEPWDTISQQILANEDVLQSDCQRFKRSP